jgi:hypothetical protein
LKLGNVGAGSINQISFEAEVCMELCIEEFCPLKKQVLAGHDTAMESHECRWTMTCMHMWGETDSEDMPADSRVTNTP